MIRPRERRLLVIGDATSKQEVINRLAAHDWTISEWPDRDADTLDDAVATLVFYGPNAEKQIIKLCSQIARALDEGLHVLVVVEEGAQLVPLKNTLKRNGLLSGSDESREVVLPDTYGVHGGLIVFTTPQEPREIALRLARIRPAPRAAVDLQVRGDVPDENRRLLQRAFADLVAIRVRPLNGGKANRGIYVVDHEPPTDPQRCLPFVAKIASRGNALKEAEAFSQHVRDQVPFASRPNFLVDRCFVGATLGILVGQFIDRARPLNDAVRADGAVRAINSLFGYSLHNWWSNSFRVSEEPFEGKVLENLSNWTDLRDPSHLAALESHFDGLKKSYETLLSPASIGERLDVTCLFRRGMRHGDLNCGNVQVRDQDAFLIDFSACSEGALLADPAWLEVHLVFHWHSPDQTRHSSDEEWAALAERLYAPVVLDRPLPPAPPIEISDELHHLWRAVRAIRSHVHSIRCSYEYRCLVAAALIRFSSRRHTEAPVHEIAHARVAYRLASEIALHVPATPNVP